GIAGLGASVKYLSEIGIDAIRQKEAALTEQLRAGLKRIPGLTLYTPDISMGVFSINLEGFDSAGLSVALEREHGILTRPGLHCAPLAHKAIGTYPQGTTRISIGYSTTEAEVEQVIKALEELSRQVR
ncbi:MAG TPA: cysteine desulfurase, partial [Firmicutes bacterium]|nr:cysteine desulfurase [Bacillota bacterium]